MIIPAIIPVSASHLRESLGRFTGVTDSFQIDVVDGVFAAPQSWPYREGNRADAIAELGVIAAPYACEIDLMAMTDTETLEQYADAGITQMVVHLEALPDPLPTITDARRLFATLGLSINNATPLERLFPYLDRVDMVQCMGIAEIGAQGHGFDERVLARIEMLRSQKPELVISVDGSVNNDTLPRLRDAGATRFVVGSAIWGAEDPVAAYAELRDMAA